MADKAWKAWERKVAADHGGTRTGPRGSNVPDVSGLPLIAPECKYQKKLHFTEADMQQARDNAPEGMIPVVFLMERGGKRKAVRLDYEDWLKLWNTYMKENNV
jgi:hypothetical protein